MLRQVLTMGRESVFQPLCSISPTASCSTRTGTSSLTHTLLLPAKSLHLYPQINAVVCRCTQAPLTKLVQIRKVIDAELYLYFPQGEDFFTSLLISEYTEVSIVPLHLFCTYKVAQEFMEVKALLFKLKLIKKKKNTASQKCPHTGE